MRMKSNGNGAFYVHKNNWVIRMVSHYYKNKLSSFKLI